MASESSAKPVSAKLVYLLWGDDRGEIRDAASKVRHSLIGAPGSEDPMAAFNHERFDASQVKSFAVVLRACAQAPMMGERRLVELASPEEVGKHAGSSDEGERAPKDPLDTLIGYLDDPSPSTTLLITSSGLKSTSRLVKAVTKLGDVAQCRRLDAPSSDDATSWIIAECKIRGIKMSSEAASELVRLAGASRGEVSISLDQVIAFAGGKPVEIRHVREIVTDKREADVFALTDAVGQGDAGKALEILARAFSKGEQDVGTAMRLFALLVRHFRLVCTARASGSSAADALGLPPFIARKYIAQANATNTARIERAYAGLARLDSDFKGGSVIASRSPYLLLQRWILDTTGTLPGSQARS